METALNAVWDGAPGPADRIAIVGGGLVGLLVGYLCARLPGAAGDGGRYRARPRRRSPARSVRALRSPTPRRPIAIWSSTPAPAPPALRPRCGSRARRRAWSSSAGTAAARSPLRSAKRSTAAGCGWYRARSARSRPRIARAGRHGRRLAAALALLEDPALDALIAPAVAFEDLPAKLPAMFDAGLRRRLPADPLSR